jgi:hypothetical protein
MRRKEGTPVGVAIEVVDDGRQHGTGTGHDLPPGRPPLCDPGAGLA